MVLRDVNPVVLPIYLIHFDRPDWTELALASFRHSDGVHLEITVIDNGGRPPHPSAGVRVLHQARNHGFAGGANAALRDWLASDYEWVVITAHDLIVKPRTFQHMLAAARHRPELGLVGPNFDEEVPEYLRRRTYSTVDGVRFSDWTSGVCMLLRRRCVEATGLFDEDYGSWWEDIDYGNRVRHAGWQVGQVIEAGASTLGRAGGSRAEILCHANRVLFAFKNGGWRKVPNACWTLTKQAVWAASHGSPTGAFENVAGMMRGTVRCMHVWLRDAGTRAVVRSSR